MPNRISNFKPPRVKQWRDPEKRDEESRKHYQTSAHRRWRRAVILRAACRCQACGTFSTNAPLHADHIIPISEGGSRLDLSNGQALCQSCHSSKTARENGFGGRGRSTG